MLLFVEEKEGGVPQSPRAAKAAGVSGEAVTANVQAIAPNILQEGCSPAALPVFSDVC